ncbi:Zn-ribbon containing protein [Halalkaliarchaeum sp. AArc-CO]|uniref:Zn-ribbon domain-containing protein n=1 Tax=unclassified Halalkaliarchaeum TaxID=2678344 RepID=UPI00217E4187|nr:MULTISPECIES: Zn-ribbon domain-containing protein [unclassified Halalkaliarchaeum]MDR5672767.1 Zn-ribbon domain-containing protein [Halalkaliarchaeum sp. AArc-GB]UWG52336.1 Zn-ribbon containing protein [Halalkaliarchaeum sp. AArc-CO]
MPHQCTSCGRVFSDGSKEMLSGCPDCGGNKFQFRPSSAVEKQRKSASEMKKRKRSTSDTGSSSRTAGRSDNPTVERKESTTEQQDEPRNEGEVVSSTDLGDSPENRAQADARSGVVSEEELSALAESTSGDTESSPDEGTGRASDREVEGERVPENVDRPDLSQLREELNSQFESIKIVSQGQYELNLMELYDRQEYIISLQEDGRYVIEMPDAWGPDDE